MDHRLNPHFIFDVRNLRRPLVSSNSHLTILALKAVARVIIQNAKIDICLTPSLVPRRRPRAPFGPTGETAEWMRWPASKATKQPIISFQKRSSPLRNCMVGTLPLRCSGIVSTQKMTRPTLDAFFLLEKCGGCEGATPPECYTSHIHLRLFIERSVWSPATDAAALWPMRPV